MKVPLRAACSRPPSRHWHLPRTEGLRAGLGLGPRAAAKASNDLQGLLSNKLHHLI